MKEDVRVAVIGAGPAGLAALRALTAAGLDAVAFERGGARRRGVDARGPADRGLPLAAPDHEPRAHGVRRAPDAATGTPDYPSREAVGTWLEDYVERFELAPRIRLGTAVEHARRRPGGGWELAVGTGGERVRADVLVVASGHNEVAALARPAVPGRVRRRAAARARLRRRRRRSRAGDVLVVGMGNSAMDIATDLSHLAARTLPVGPPRELDHPQAPARQARRPGHPAVGRRARPVAAAPAGRADAAAADGRAARGRRAARARRAGCSSRTRRSPTRSSRGSPTARSRRSRRSRRSTATACASPTARREAVDAIVWCTGYRVTIPFLERGAHRRRPAASSPLYKRVLHLDVPRPLLRRADAVDGLGVPDPRAPVAAARRAT